MRKTALEELQDQEESLIEKRNSVERKLKAGSNAVNKETLAALNAELAQVQERIGLLNNPKLAGLR